MAQEWARAFYKSKKWIKCRDSYIRDRIMIDGGLCEECRNNPGYIVHHKEMLTAENVSDPDVSLNHWKLKYVCRECHDLYEGHGLNRAAKPLCTFDTEGQPVSLRRIDQEVRRDPDTPP